MSIFQLKPIKSARVSEISEATAAAQVPDTDKLNFHIGNPLQDSRLSSAFLRIALGFDIQDERFTDRTPDQILSQLGWASTDKYILEFLTHTIHETSPYAPRGGFSRQAPHPLVHAFNRWLTEQHDSLIYDTGDKTAHREIILSSGGVFEAFRVMLFVLATYMENAPALILNYHCHIPAAIREPHNLLYQDLSTTEEDAYHKLEHSLITHPDTPVFLLIGKIQSEKFRRKLHLLSKKKPIFFIEANDAPNHLSLAREAKLIQRVIRFLTPGIFGKHYQSLATTFITGNGEYLHAFENVHFQLKGTPSTSEIELVNFILTHKQVHQNGRTKTIIPFEKPACYGLEMDSSKENIVLHMAEHKEKQADERTDPLESENMKPGSYSLQDEFANLDPKTLLLTMLENLEAPGWIDALKRNFLSKFIKHQPQYEPQACQVVSGSSRTGLSLLGHHCGISEVVIPDLSWSYEECFQKTHVVPLTMDFNIDASLFINKLEELHREDPEWKNKGAIVISNPHNATGRIFDEIEIRKIITFCLQNNFYILEDLAYQNVVPVDALPNFKTVRQISNELVDQGVLTAAQAEKLITIHTLSKTDSLAGARLAVIEIRENSLYKKFKQINDCIQPNITAIFLSYLLYRGSRYSLKCYWHYRNRLFHERSRAIISAASNLPEDRNMYGIEILPPQGGLYPLLTIDQLPAGLSLNWLASTMARTGIGLLPLSTFARTEQGYEASRKAFRLTLGGKDSTEALQAKTRRLLINLNLLINEEGARFNREVLEIEKPPALTKQTSEQFSTEWDEISARISSVFNKASLFKRGIPNANLDAVHFQEDFNNRYLPERLKVFRTRLYDRAAILSELYNRASNPNDHWLAEHLENEFYKDSLRQRQDFFKKRIYDRTVHPTQMYSLKAEIAFDTIIQRMMDQQPVEHSHITTTAHELLKEYYGNNIHISAKDEVHEIQLDLGALIAAEDYSSLFAHTSQPTFLSFWSDWDGSTRPSGQGHQLIGILVMENVKRMTRIIRQLQETDSEAKIDAHILSQIEQLPEQNKEFSEVLNNITALTHQLEQRYRGILPFTLNTTSLQRLATKLNLRRDPARILWQHNDRYEKKMFELRSQRSDLLEDYFSLNKKMRKQLYALIPQIVANRGSDKLVREVASFHDLLKRTVITPRIHENLITKRDQFAIDTTVYNINEINSISGRYGSPGMILALQVSMASKPEALISLNRKLSNQGRKVLREQPLADLPPIWLIPLFEERNTVENLEVYLDHIWEYSTQNYQASQSPKEKFSEIISEVFIAGSDLSQQLSQAASANLFRRAKFKLNKWLSEHDLTDDVRIKLGCGESMQRQGGYYSPVSGLPAFISSGRSKSLFAYHLPAAAAKSTEYATTPLQGIFLDADLKTFQSNIAEHLRFLPVSEVADLTHHLREAQAKHHFALNRAAEKMADSRIGTRNRNIQELLRLTIKSEDSIYEDFLKELTTNFRQILYGKQEDVFGLHIITFFIGRSLPQLRDRPTYRKRSSGSADQGQQILANIAKIIPFSDQGSLLRAIAHNRAQTVVLGINQLSTGLFRAIERYAQRNFPPAEHDRIISEHILPNLPVYEILNNLRIYQDQNRAIFQSIESAFPPGNSILSALREDDLAMYKYLPLFKQELLRRHGLNVKDFCDNGNLIQDILPTLRPDLAVLLQRNLFNTEIDFLLEQTDGTISEQWKHETDQLLEIPVQIQYWRSIIWETIGESIYLRVQSFAELATAIYGASSQAEFTLPKIQQNKNHGPISTFFDSAHANDEMRQFLHSTLNYLNSFLDDNNEVPISIIRAINDVEHIIQLEETTLNPKDQATIRFCLLQIARLAQENS